MILWEKDEKYFDLEEVSPFTIVFVKERKLNDALETLNQEDKEKIMEILHECVEKLACNGYEVGII